MKLKYLLIAVLAGAALVGCNKTPDNPENGTGQKSYMSISVVAPTATKGTVGDPEFDGIEKESQIDNIFFFFYVNNAFLCEGKVITDMSQFGFTESVTNNTVEKYAKNAVVVLETDGTKPNGVLCFINLDANDRTNIKGKTLTEALAYSTEGSTVAGGVKHIQFGYEKVVEGEKKYFFTMSNSVFYNATESKWEYAYKVLGNNCCATPDEAKASPVTLHLDRIASKVSEVDLSSVAADTPAGIEGYNFKINLQSWGLNGVNRMAYFTKRVNESWKKVGETGAYDWMQIGVADHRMHWERDVNYTESEKEKEKFPNDAPELGKMGEGVSPLWYYSYNQITNSAAEAIVAATQFNHNKDGEHQYSGGLVRNYCFPNTFDDSFKANFRRVGTHVLVMAQAKMDDAVVDFYEYNGAYYTKKNYILKALANMQSTFVLYYKDGSAWKRVDSVDEDLDEIPDNFVIEKALYNETTKVISKADASTNYYSDGFYSIFLKEGLDQTNVYLLTDPSNPGVDASYELLDNDQWKQVFSTDVIVRSNFYKDGLMYYCVPIEHLGSATDAIGTHGMVRNHDYRVKVTGVTGLGKGIGDPNEPIVPGDKAEKWYLAATIMINAWHVVNQTVNLSE